MKTLFSNRNLFEGNDLLNTIIIPRKLDKNPLEKPGDKSTDQKMVAPPVNTNSEKLWLYFEGEKGSFIGSQHADYPNYFLERGYEVLENPAPSLLVDVANHLYTTKEVLWKLDVPIDTNIILIGTPPLFTDFGSECFFNARLASDGYVFSLISADIIDFSDSIFIVKKS